MEYGYNLLKIQKHNPFGEFSNGIQIGITPSEDPRGLIRIYTSYLEYDEFIVNNFIAFEPIDRAKNNRRLPESEWSQLDNIRGKRFGVEILLKLTHFQINITKITE